MKQKFQRSHRSSSSGVHQPRADSTFGERNLLASNSVCDEIKCTKTFSHFFIAPPLKPIPIPKFLLMGNVFSGIDSDSCAALRPWTPPLGRACDWRPQTCSPLVAEQLYQLCSAEDGPYNLISGYLYFHYNPAYCGISSSSFLNWSHMKKWHILIVFFFYCPSPGLWFPWAPQWLHLALGHTSPKFTGLFPGLVFFPGTLKSLY